MKKKAALLLVLGLLALMVFTAVASAATTVTLTGKVVYSTIEKPHYELWVTTGMYAGMKYVLSGPFDFSKYVGKTIKASGTIYPYTIYCIPGFSVSMILAVY
ncbi:hypothetical protein [Carboxydothermus ferrireducens]|uniref:Uncharacterized protein n=1 Tax=Carboxydothermus ferrireducens DSM 11255 TaxID=1119529 RepID=A0ABX2R7R3_9THEO|nr:hypothetical protein [Carboxydothermus ferrireducens]NYE57216.1 hypothetical protein [Carboxydothermus ferrireducens DSM 11255]